MKVIVRHISLILIALFCVIGVLQFHHHDCNGDAYIAINVADINLTGGSIGHCDHAGHPECADSHSGQHAHSCDGRCALHMATAAGVDYLLKHQSGQISASGQDALPVESTLAINTTLHESVKILTGYLLPSFQKNDTETIDVRGSPMIHFV